MISESFISGHMVGLLFFLLGGVGGILWLAVSKE